MIVCIKHSEYQGQSAPVLSCDQCCRIFIAECQKRHQVGEPLPDKWEVPSRENQVNSSVQEHVVWLDARKNQQVFAQAAPHSR